MSRKYVYQKQVHFAKEPMYIVGLDARNKKSTTHMSVVMACRTFLAKKEGTSQTTTITTGIIGAK